MKSLQDYIDIYRSIATKLNYQGDSVEVLVQMLANASYISEVENISYAQEASLERATLINSKIQHCVNDMYSVFRGACPRVIIKFKPTKYLSFEVFQKIVSGNGFNIYYLGYYDPDKKITNSTGLKTFSTLENFTYAPLHINSVGTGQTYVIVGLLCKELITKEWVIDVSNRYFVDCLENNLSNDVWVKIGEGENNYYEVSREFSDHIIEGNVFDLTLPNFGSRLYISEAFRDSTKKTLKSSESTVPSNTKVEANYFRYSSVNDYNTFDLKRISIKGTTMESFTSSFLENYGRKELEKGIIIISEVGRDSLNTIHYKASRDRYVNSILRSNSDIGTVLEELYPDKIVSGGTSYKFSEENNSITIYYVPQITTNLLTTSEIQNFISSRKSYYVTDRIIVTRGTLYTAIFNIDVEIYQNTNIENELKGILNQYENKFGINLGDKVEEIKSLISKISNVKQIMRMNIEYLTEDGESIDSDKLEIINSEELYRSFFKIDYVINSVIR